MASLFCPVCGTENPPTRQFCRKCAADLRAPVPDATAPVVAEAAPVPIRPIAIGGGIALILVVLGIGAVALLGGSPAASPSPTIGPTASPVATAAPTPAATVAPTPTVAPTTAPTPTPAATSAGTGKPVVDSFSGPRSASCTGTNGTSTTGYIKLKWSASNTTGVRLSIDPPAANDAYDYGYDDYPAQGEAEVPFTCDPPNSDSGGSYHLYVATTLHDGGRWAYRFIKVYVKA